MEVTVCSVCGEWVELFSDAVGYAHIGSNVYAGPDHDSEDEGWYRCWAPGPLPEGFVEGYGVHVKVWK